MLMVFSISHAMILQEKDRYVNAHGSNCSVLERIVTYMIEGASDWWTVAEGHRTGESYFDHD
jgi:hypothetical protein